MGKSSEAMQCALALFLVVSAARGQSGDIPECSVGSSQCSRFGDLQCYTSDERCDGRQFCDDGSDEEGCATGSMCNKDEFLCDQRRCIPASSRCDGERDCTDRTDETFCTSCRPDAFRCWDGSRCISRRDLCDGTRECADGSDEYSTSCPRVSVSQPVALAVEGEDELRVNCAVTCDSQPCAAPRWSSRDSRDLPFNARQVGNELVFRSLRRENSGFYQCEANGETASAEVRVTDRPSVRCRSEEFRCANDRCVSRGVLCDGRNDCGDESDEHNCAVSGKCEPNQFLCGTGQCYQKNWRCDGDEDCADGSDEVCPSVQPAARCQPFQYQCQSSQCIRKAYECDDTFDCNDRSDEVGCSAPVVTEPPVGSLDVDVGGTISITCRAIGKPVPYINWRFNWGFITADERRVTITNTDGFGVLVIRNAQPSDAGLYTCEAISTRGIIFGQPDTRVTVSRDRVCRRPFFNSLARSRGECIPCWCREVTDLCASSQFYVSALGFNRVGSMIVNSRNEPVPSANSRLSFDSATRSFTFQNRQSETLYLRMPAQFAGNRLSSYGEEIAFRVAIPAAEFVSPNTEPEVIVVTRRGTLVSSSNSRFGASGSVYEAFSIQEFLENRFPQRAGGGDSGGLNLLGRFDFLRAITDVEYVLLKLTYLNDRSETVTLSDLKFEFGQTSRTATAEIANKVEVCDCPRGYRGTSCQECAAGFNFAITPTNENGICVEAPRCDCSGQHGGCDATGRCLCEAEYQGSQCEMCRIGWYRDPSSDRFGDCLRCNCYPGGNVPCAMALSGGVVRCDCPQGYEGPRCERCASGLTGDPPRGVECVPGPIIERCNVAGTDTRGVVQPGRQCVCKANVEGSLCDSCRARTYNLAESNPSGCSDCFCMGVSRQCRSSSYDRTIIPVSEISLRTRGVDSVVLPVEVLGNGAFTIRDRRALQDNNVYWELPDLVKGNQLNSYDGYIRYTVSVRVSSPNRDSSDEPEIILIGGENINLIHIAPDRQFSNLDTMYTYQARFVESEWAWLDGTEDLPRELFLQALQNISGIYILASRNRDIIQSGIREVIMDSAKAPTSSPSSLSRPRASGVESCSCPAGYLGQSCERCSPGYTRATGLYLGICVRCSCSGRSNECDAQSGVCQCPAAYTGSSCDSCARGFTRDVSGDCRSSGGRIEVILTPADTTLRSGDDVTLFCDVRNAVGVVAIEWSYPVAPLPSQERGEFSTRRYTNDQLKLSFTTLFVGGIYSCAARTTTGRFFSGNAIVRIVRIVPFRVVVTPSDLSIQTGATGEFTCRVQPASLAVRSYTWTFTPDTLASGIIDSPLSAGRSLSTHRILDASPSQQGLYTCSIVLDNGSRASDSGRLVVAPVRRVRTTPSGVVDMELGSSVIIVCEATGSPLRMSWSRVGQGILALTSSRDTLTLSLTVSSATQAGQYVCTAEYVGDEEVNTLVVVRVRQTVNRPVVSLLTTRAVVGEERGNRLVLTPGGSGSLECVVTSGPVDSFTFTRRGQLRLPANVRQTDNYLSFTDGSVDQAGEYICTASNSVGTTEATAQVIIMPPAPNLQQSHVLVTLGQAFQVECAVPPVTDLLQVSWINPRNRLVAGPSPNRVQLIVDFVRAEDAGVYRCVSSIGGYSVESTLNVTVHDRGIFFQPSFVQMRRRAGDPFIMDCLPSGDSLGRITYRWYRGNQPDTTLSTERYLQIGSVNGGDEGMIHCQASDGTTPATLRVQLTVIDAPPSKPLVTANGVIVPDRAERLYSRRTELRLVCTARGADFGATVSWSIAVGASVFPVESNARVEASGGRLTIRQLDAVDSNVYRCTARNSEGSSYSNIDVRVNGAEPPRGLVIVGGRGALPWTVGDSTLLRCRASGTAPITYTWTFTSGPLPANAREEGSGTLRLTNLAISNTGEYVCAASNSAGRSLRAEQINVQRPTPTVVDPPRPSGLPTEIDIGDSVTLECLLPTGAFAINFGRVNGKEFPTATRIFNQGQSLRITDIDFMDGGDYFCTAVYPGAITSARAIMTLNVVQGMGSRPGLPLLSGASGNGLYELGKDIFITCLSDGDPPPSISWEKVEGATADENVRITGNTLSIGQLLPENSGTYRCTARNELGTATIDHTVRGVPGDGPSVPTTIDRRPSAHRVSLGDSLELTCVSSDDLPVEWSKEGVTLRGEGGNGNVLVLDSINARDAGTYMCNAVDSDDRRSDPLRHTVGIETSPPSVPVISTGSESPTPEDQEGSWYCASEGFPSPRITWERVDGDLPAKTEVSGATLRLQNFTRGDAGIYRCTAINSYGQSSKAIIADYQDAGLNVCFRPKVVGRCRAAFPRFYYDTTLQRCQGFIYGGCSGNANNFELLSECEASCTNVGSGKTIQFNIAGQSANGVYALGSNITFTCAVPLPLVVRWIRDGGAKELPSRADVTRFSGGSELELTGLTEADEGNYQCIGLNPVTILTELSPDGPVSISAIPSDVAQFRIEEKGLRQGDEYVEGTELIISCSVLPAGLYEDLVLVRAVGDVLTRASEPADDGITTLRISDLSVSDAGLYTCAATSIATGEAFTSKESARILVTASKPPTYVLIEVTSGETLTFGSDVTLRCSSNGVPPARYTWVQADGTTPVDSRYEVETKPTYSVLTIPSFSVSDLGEYICRATNDFGSEMASASIGSG